jgi:hypothetical protein
VNPAAPSWPCHLRRVAFLLLVTTPLSAEFASGSWVRIGRLSAAEQTLYVVLALGSACLWAALLSLAGRGRLAWVGRCAVALGLALVVGIHWVMWSHYSSVLTSGLLEQASHQGWDVRRTMQAGRTDLLLSAGIPVVILGSLGALARAPDWMTALSHRLRWGLVALCLTVASVGPRAPSRPMDFAILGSTGSFLLRWTTGQVKPAVASANVPWLPALEANRINVLVILTESVRYDAYCNDPSADCTITPVVQRVFPERLPFPEMRAVSSWTIQSLATITTGLGTLATRDELDRAPSIFDFARAAGRHTELASAQRLKHLYLRSAGLNRVTGFDDLTRNPDYERADDDLSRLMAERLQSMPEPYFVLMQYGDTHTPYTIDPRDAPFTPYGRDFSWEGTPRLLNQYQNAVHLQDRLMGQMLERLLASGRLDHTVVLFTSDHGEAFREHLQLFHGGSLRDQEIHVATWIWVPEAVREELEHRYAALLARRTDFVTHLDVLPTLLDLFGVYDDPAIRPHLASLAGHSLMRPRPIARPAALTNCSALMDCAFRTFGVLEERYELEAREWDGYWNCWELGQKTHLLDMGAPPCQALLRESRKIHPRLPNGQRY